MSEGKVQVRVMGPFEVRCDGAPVAFPARSAAAVVAYLALCRPRSITRGELAGILWPDTFRDTALGALRTALYRVRHTLSPHDVLAQEDDRLFLRLDRVETDLDEADVRRRQFQIEGLERGSVEILRQEWQIRRGTLLEGWDDPWVEPWRERARRQADEVAVELALAYEEFERPEEALRVWRDVLERVPNHVEAIRSVVRLEYEVNGAGKAALFAREALAACHTDYGLELPMSLQRALRDVRSGLFEPVRPSDHIRKRSELNALANMVTRNLESNAPEALAMIAREVKRPEALEHPRTTLALASTALRLTTGSSVDRLELASQAAHLASLCAEYELAVEWADLVLAATVPEQPIYTTVLGIKGFVEFERRDYRSAERCLDEAIAVLEGQDRPDDLLLTRGRRAGVWWHQGRFDEAEAEYLAVYRRSEGRSDRMGSQLCTFASGNLCFLNVHARRWERAREWGLIARAISVEIAPYRNLIRAPLGLALTMDGQPEEGVRELSEAIADLYRLRLPRYHQISLDYAAVALHRADKEGVARCVLAANSEYRATIRHVRSMAEISLVQGALGVDPDSANLVRGNNPLLGQTPGVLSEWTIDELRRAY